MLAARKGKPIAFSTGYQELGLDSPTHIQEVIRNKRAEWPTRYTPSGERVLIRAGVIYDEKERPHVPYFVAIAHNLSQGESLLRSSTTTTTSLVPQLPLPPC